MVCKQAYATPIRENTLLFEPFFDREFSLPVRERAGVRGRCKFFSPSPHSSPIKGGDVTGQLGSGFVVVLLLFFLSAVMPVPVYSQSLSQLIDGAKKEGTLNLSWGTGTMGGIEGVQAMEKVFNKNYGLNFQFKYAPGPAMPQFASRIIQEAKAGQPASSDLFIGSENHVARMSLKKLDWTKTFPHISRPMVDWEGRVLIVVSRTPGLTYNTNLIAANEVPQKVEDLLNPKWKGKIASTPYAASFDRLALIWGEEKATAFLQKFVKQVAGLIRCGEEERILNGEFALMAFNCDLADANEMREKGAPVNGKIFKDAGILSYWYLAVPSNSAHPNAASLLAALLLSKEGQDILWKSEKTSSHLVDGTYMYKFVKEQERQGVKFYANPVSEVVKNQENQSRLRQKFQDILMGK
jgi:iron(III) transport system substrate-binding protein